MTAVHTYHKELLHEVKNKDKLPKIAIQETMNKIKKGKK